MIIVNFAGGIAGDLVAAVIDSKDCYVTENGKTQLPFIRKTMKQRRLNTVEEKDSFIYEISKKYKSIPSHECQYHKLKNHNTIGIGIKNQNLYKIAAERFVSLNEPNLINKLFGINTIDEFVPILIDITKQNVEASKHVIYFDDILSGKLLENLQFIDSELDAEFYQKWLKHCGNR